jgi:hypothetical protein
VYPDDRLGCGGPDPSRDALRGCAVRGGRRGMLIVIVLLVAATSWTRLFGLL